MTRRQKYREAARLSQNNLCCYCRVTMNWAPEGPRQGGTASSKILPFTQCTAEHLMAVSDGGTDSRENIVAACRFCNQNRHRSARPKEPGAFKTYVQARVRRGTWWPVQGPLRAALLRREENSD